MTDHGSGVAHRSKMSPERLLKKLLKLQKNPEKLVGTRWRYTCAESTRRYYLHVAVINKKRAVMVTVHSDRFRIFHVRLPELFGDFSPFKYVGTSEELSWIREDHWVIAKDQAKTFTSRRGAWRILRISGTSVECQDRLRQGYNQVFHRNIFEVISDFREATREEREEGRRLQQLPRAESVEQIEEDLATEQPLPEEPPKEPEVERQPFWKNLVEEDV